MTPHTESATIALTRKGEAYVYAHGALPGCPAGVEAHQWRRAVRDRVEAHLAAVEALLAALDGSLPDSDLEDTGDDEPSLGGAVLHGEVDLELDPVDDEDTGDNEPSLGSPEIPHYGSQLSWAKGGRDDREDDGDDKEPTEDSEPADPDADDITWGGGSDERPLAEQQELYRVLGHPAEALL